MKKLARAKRKAGAGGEGDIRYYIGGQRVQFHQEKKRKGCWEEKGFRPELTAEQKLVSGAPLEGNRT